MELCIDRLTKQYGHKLAVDRVDLELHQGVYGLLGANGAGKTTLMRMLCDILTPTSGRSVTMDRRSAPWERITGAVLGICPRISVITRNLRRRNSCSILRR